MKRLAIPFACLIASLPHASIAGEAKVEQVTVTEPTGQVAQRITFHADRVTMEQGIEQFTKASGLPLAINVSTFSNRAESVPAPIMYYDINIQDEPVEKALDHLARTLNVRIEPNSNDNSTSLQVQGYNPAGYMNQGRPLGDGTLKISPSYISRRASLPVTAKNPPTLDIDFQVEGGSRQLAINFPKITIEQAVDEQGRNLTPMNKNQPTNGEGPQPLDRLNATFRFRYPDPPAKRITILKGVAEYQIPATNTRVTFTGLTDGKPIKTQVNGMDMELAAPTKSGDNWEINLKVHRPATIPKQAWPQRESMLFGSFRASKITTAAGVVMEYRGGGGGGGDTPTFQLYAASPNTSPDKATDGPSTLVWEMPAETASLRLPFQAADIAVP